ncbi:MAG: DUF3857 domain-containing protein [Acidobacteriota bacterium]
MSELFLIHRLHRAAKMAAPCWFLAALALASPSWATEFPAVTDAERELKSLAWEPGASAVVLYRDAELRFRDFSRNANSRLVVEQRIKILTDEGVDAGVREIYHSRFLRLGEIDARTVTPAGEEIIVPEDEIFTELRSRTARSYVTKVTFPSVTSGSILDLRFELFWDSLYYLEPWLFHQDLPVVRSKITYIKPDNLKVNTWGRQTSPQEFQIDTNKSPGGMRIDVALENLGALPAEPFSFPTVDLSSRFMIVPTQIYYSGSQIDLLSDWKNVCETFEDDTYLEFLKGSRRDVRKKGKALTAGATGARAQIEKIFGFVRDDVTTESGVGVYVAADRDAGDVLGALSGTPVEKTLLLRALLDAVKIEADSLWVADRREGGVVPDVPNPAWFSGMILETEIDGATTYLDPNDPGNAVGTLLPFLEGTIAVNCQRKKDQALNLPTRPPASNQRKAHVKLAIDEEGQLSGEGSLVLGGHSAWRWLGVFEDQEAAAEDWTKRLTEDFPGFLVGDLSVEEDVARQSVSLQFQLTQREEDVLGDEVSLGASRPLHKTQPFSLPADKRRTPVQLSFGYSDQSTLEITWPEGWELDLLPDDVQHEGPAGAYAGTYTVDEATRHLKYSREFSLGSHQFIGDEAYEAVRSLYDVASTHDAHEVVWIQP